MVGRSLVTVVEQPDIAHVKNLVSALTEEFLEVLGWFRDLGEPYHSGQVRLATLHVCSFELNTASIGLNGSLCVKGSKHQKLSKRVI